jgi:hypothetical protein
MAGSWWPTFSQVGINPKMSLPPLPDRFLKRERSTTELGDTQTTTSSLNAYVHIFGCSPSPLCLSCVVAPWSLLVTAFAPLNLSQADGLFPLVFKGPEALWRRKESDSSRKYRPEPVITAEAERGHPRSTLRRLRRPESESILTNEVSGKNRDLRSNGIPFRWLCADKSSWGPELLASETTDTNLRACTTSPMNGRFDASGCTHLEAMLATFLKLSNGKLFLRSESTRICSPSSLVSRGRAHVTRCSSPGGLDMSTGFRPVKSSSNTTP